MIKIKGLFNTNVYVHWTTALVIFIGFLKSTNSGFILCGLYLSVVLHEFGHVFAAQRLSVKTGDISILPFGGVAMVDFNSLRDNEISWKEFYIGIAGPLVSLFLGCFFFLFGPESFLFNISAINFLLLFFNLLPLFPMDGGRVLRSILNFFFKDVVRSTKYAVRISQVFCMLILPLSIYWGLYMMGIIMVLVAFMGEAELQSIKAFRASALQTVTSEV